MKRLGILLFSLGLFFIKGWAAEWQWSVPVSKVIAPETGGHPQAFLWIPEDCMQVRAVMIGTHNMCEETLFENELFRRRMKEAGVALIWITPGWDQQWKADSGSPEAYWQMLDDLAETSGYGELKIYSHHPDRAFRHGDLPVEFLRPGIRSAPWPWYLTTEMRRVRT